MRFANPDGLTEYENGSPGSVDFVDAGKRLEEAWFLGLRENCGVSTDDIRKEFGTLALGHEEIADQLAYEGLLAKQGSRFRLTPRGRMMSNDVFARFVTSGELVCA